MKRFGWEIVKGILNSSIIQPTEFKEELERGYKDGWRDFFVNEADPRRFFSVEIIDSNEPEKNFGYRLGYTLSLNDCKALTELGENLKSDISAFYENFELS